MEPILEKRKEKYDIDVKFSLTFQTEEFTEYQNAFKGIDNDNDGFIDRSELRTALHSLGFRSMTEDDVVKLITEIDININIYNKVAFDEFLVMMKSFKDTGKERLFPKVVTEEGSKVAGDSNNKAMGYCSFSEEERSAFVQVINTSLKDDEVCQNFLPIDPDTMEIFTILKNGILLCKLINKAHPGLIDERVINIKDNMSIFLVTENLKLALNAAKAIGCQITDISPDTIIEEKYPLILGLLWQIIKQIILGGINLKNYPQMIRLLKSGEVLSDLLKLNPEELLLRWFNYHLTNAGYDKKITNFSEDVKDGEKYAILLNQLDSSLCDKSALNETDLAKRAKCILDNSKKLGVETYITSKDICDGNAKLNTLFTASIFNACHGLDLATEEETYEAAKILSDDAEGSRGERAFRMWINSLELPGVQYVNHLYEDCRSGVLLLKVIDKVKPGSVDWKKVDEKTTNKFKKVVNCNEAVSASKKAGFTIVGIGGQDIYEANKKYILAIVWQLMREHTLQVIGNKTEDDLVKWANDLAPTEHRITSLKDKKLKTGLFFIHLMSAIEPRAINWALVITDKEGDDALENNAKYALSIARKLGASIFVVWEDIKEVKSTMLLTFIASLYDVYQLESQLRTEKNNIRKAEERNK